jgi:hypothetical protein
MGHGHDSSHHRGLCIALSGDVFLMDLRLLHTPSVNATKNERMMATARCFFDT